MQLISLERAAQKLCEQRNNVFVPTTIGVKVIRERLELEQSAPVYQHVVTEKTENFISDKFAQEIPFKIIYPVGLQANEKVPVVFFVHGGQFMTGNIQTHRKLINELVNRAGVGVIFPEYSLAPEEKAPTQLKQLKELFQHLPMIVEKYPFDLTRLIVAGDDVGGGMAVSLALLMNEEQELPIYKMLLFCPVVNANFDTFSYHQYAGGYDLTREQMKWSWQQYLGLQADSLNYLFSPLQASLEQLAKLPEILIMTAEADVVRDEGEAIARKIRDAGGDVVQIRFQGITHDFMVKNMLDRTNACRLAMNIAVDWIKRNGKRRK
ncbi:alpha/beta hydrolase [Liquorilactobacillus capillatus]|uniref:Alpha beta hydrolase fold family protein n=1 Tax=Liquorilactobacillus capillatus DSM 19910 TaxID=1423731 RepID=A0A0R1LZU9_9LACO|nr:alpha/beta hydrolase [Liquorilactobacillus capillatus]KRL01270.1 alpha beta hydrolase fold family protein [Liquorilactobacillus capillatus DSM 19910]